MIIRQTERIKRSMMIDKLILATSNDQSDDPLAELCNLNDIYCYRGSLNDVLDRFYRTAESEQPDHVVRLTGDCPLIDPVIVDEIIKLHLKGQYDYTSNCIERTFPDGLDTEVFTFLSLSEAWREAILPSHREHVTPFIHQQPKRYSLGHYKQTRDLSALRWTVDESEDYILIKNIYEALYPVNQAFTTADILTYLDEHPELQAINKMYKCNEGLGKSLHEDEQYLKSFGIKDIKTEG